MSCPRVSMKSRVKTFKLKKMNIRLCAVNQRLRAQIEKLKLANRKVKLLKIAINKKCCKKIKRLVTVHNELQDIFKVSHSLASAGDLQKAYSLVVRLTCELMHTDTCVLRLIEGRHSMVVNFPQKGPYFKENNSIIRKVISTKKPLVIYDLSKNNGFKSALSIPLLAQDKVVGVISTYSQKARHFSKEETEVLSIFASQLAKSLQENKYSEEMHANYFSAIHALVLTLEARDPFTRGHTDRVTSYALKVGRKLCMSENELETLRYAGEVHDIGKISIPDFILNKPGKLSLGERAIIQLHPVKGAEVLEPLEFLRPAIPIVRHHHERYDGKGYPDGLKKNKIPLMARILACADSFDAMTSDRPYRANRLTLKEAILEIKNNSGTQFDPHIAYLFIKIIKKNPLN